MQIKRKTFTDEQIFKLQKNNYTHRVTPSSISFTLEFKEFFVQQREIPGMTTPKIFLKAGYDTTVLTKRHMNGIRQRILDEFHSPGGLKEPRGLSKEDDIRAFEKKDLSRQKTEDTINELQQRIVHLEKQVEFLKKIYG